MNLSRRKLRRRLRGLEGDGVRVVWRATWARMQVDGVPAEVVEYADKRGVELRLCELAGPVELLAAVEAAEGFFDDLERIGEWKARVPRWRGVALRGTK